MTPDFLAEMETRFRDHMTAEYGAYVPLYYSNVPVPETVGSFAVIHVIASDRVTPINFGIEAKSRNGGIIQIDVFTPKDTGSSKGLRIAKFAAKIFHRKSLHVSDEGFVVLRDASIQDRGEVRGRHKEMVSIPYRYDFKLT